MNREPLIKMKYSIFANILILQAGFFSGTGIGQTQSQFVEAALFRQTNEPLRIGLVVWPNGVIGSENAIVITKEKYKTIHIYGYGDPKSCRYQGGLSSLDKDNLRHFLKIVCDTDSSYHRYQIGDADDDLEFEGQSFFYNNRVSHRIVFYSPHAISGMRNLDFKWSPLVMRQAMKAQNRKREPGFTASGSIMATTDSSYVFRQTFYYDRTSTEMTIMELELQQVDTNRSLRRTLDLVWKPVCDACGLAVHHDGRQAQYGLMGGFALPDLPFPLLVFNTSNVHEQAISFTTFREDGGFEEHRIIENKADCLEQP